MSGIITGFVEGLITYTESGTAKMLPFADKIENATFTYTSESVMSETFSNQGIKGVSASCPFRESCSMQLGSSNLAWSFLQAASNTLARDGSINPRKSYSYVVQDADLDTGDATISVDFTPVNTNGDSILVADENGKHYEVTYDDSAGTITVTDPNGDITAGQKLIISYKEAASGTHNEIALGSGSKLGEIGLYGRFFGCPDTLLIAIPRARIDSNLEMSVGEEAASASLTATALRDNNGNFAVITRQ
jgi:YD repeat-containing protein